MLSPDSTGQLPLHEMASATQQQQLHRQDAATSVMACPPVSDSTVIPVSTSSKTYTASESRSNASGLSIRHPCPSGFCCAATVLVGGPSQLDSPDSRRRTGGYRCHASDIRAGQTLDTRRCDRRCHGEDSRLVRLFGSRICYQV